MHHRGSRSGPGDSHEKSSKRSRHSRSRSAERRHHSDDKENAKRSEKKKKKKNIRESDITDLTSKKLKDCQDHGEDQPVDLSAGNNKRSSSVSDDGTSKNKKDINKYETSRKENKEHGMNDPSGNSSPEGLGVEPKLKSANFASNEPPRLDYNVLPDTDAMTKDDNIDSTNGILSEIGVSVSAGGQNGKDMSNPDDLIKSY